MYLSEGPQTALSLALHRGLYLAIIIHLWGATNSLTMFLDGGIYFLIIMDRYRGRHTALNMALL
jgi:hypothetical protein